MPTCRLDIVFPGLPDELAETREQCDRTTGRTRIHATISHQPGERFSLAHRPALSLAASRSCCTSRIGGTPKRLLYSRLKWEASWYPTRYAVLAASRSSSSIRRGASS